MIIKPAFSILHKRLLEPRKFIQALLGPRQVGKTTLINQVLERITIPYHYVSADAPGLESAAWLMQQWEVARLKYGQTKSEVVFVVDEIQKLPDWPEVVKKLWDEDTKNKIPLKLVLLGSAPWLVQKGLSESLAGRFEEIYLTHWLYADMKKAFGFTLEQYIYFGGYPGAAGLIDDEQRWKNYVSQALIETVLARDIMLFTRIDKPALLRHLFQLGCEYSGQILSYQKMLGQLHDAGNTTTLAHYLELLSKAWLLTGIENYSKHMVRQRASSPKLMVYNTALKTSQSGLSFAEFRNNPEIWGRLVECAVGAHLLNQSVGSNVKVFYWREKNQEVDFVLQYGKKIIGIEVKSGSVKSTPSGMHVFQQAYSPNKIIMVGNNGLSFEDFFTTTIEQFFAI